MLTNFHVILALCAVAIAKVPASLPVVDLKHERHQASSFNPNGAFYNFSNIRYAEPPIGKYRFRAPVPPRGRSRKVNQGKIGRICPQANPAWGLIAEQFVEDYLTGQPFNLSAASAAVARTSGSLPPQDPRTSEDCLFLDVIAPKTIFDQCQSTRKAAAPVLVWIHGGGYTAGEKTGGGLYNPSGLLKISQAAGSQGFVFVAINYRLGAFGWLAGPDLQADGTANAALYDQRLALHWVRDNIHLFGGDSERVTVIGESAGGGSIMHHITAFGGLHGPVPFKRAIIQSAAFNPVPSNFMQQQAFDKYLSLLNVKTIAEARRLPSNALIAANIVAVGRSTYGSATFGPVVDGLITPALPGKLLLQGSFDKSVTIMVGHNVQEGIAYTDPRVTNDAAFRKTLANDFPGVSPGVLDYIDKTLYPAVFDGTYGYTNSIGRLDLAISEFGFSCNANYLADAFRDQAHAYLFSVPPALHGDDVRYTFFNGSNNAVTSKSTAVALQTYITSFAEKGIPDGKSVPIFPLYGDNSDILDLNITGITKIKDPAANNRCAWWQRGLYY